MNIWVCISIFLFICLHFVGVMALAAALCNLVVADDHETEEEKDDDQQQQTSTSNDVIAETMCYQSQQVIFKSNQLCIIVFHFFLGQSRFGIR